MARMRATCRTCLLLTLLLSALKQGVTKVVVASGADSDLARKRTAVQQLIAAYRNAGARWADLDPLKRQERPVIPELEPSFLVFRCGSRDRVQRWQHFLR